MATSLLRLGRLGSLKCLHLESLGVLRTRLAASFCTQAEEPTKSAKKTKAASKTVEVPDERATFLAYKTAVVFPLRLSEHGVFAVQSSGVTEPMASPNAIAENITAAAPVAASITPAVAEPQAPEASAASADVAQIIADTAPPVFDTAPPTAEPLANASSETSAPDNTILAASTTGEAIPAAMASSELGGAAADRSSSLLSSDSSDSDSDSDSENNQLEVKTQAKSSPPEVSEYTVKEEAEVKEVTSVMKEDTNEAERAVQLQPEATPAFAAEAVQEAAPAAVSTEAGYHKVEGTFEEPSAGSEEFGVSAKAAVVKELKEDVPCSAILDAQVQAPAEDVAEAGTPGKAPTNDSVKTAAPAEAPSETSEVAPEPAAAEAAPVEANAEAVKAEDVSTEAAADAATEVSASLESTEERVDSASIITEAIPAETEAVSSEIAADAAAEVSARVESTEELVDSASVVDKAPPGETEAVSTEAAADAAAESSAHVESTEELVDTAPVVAEAAGEDLQADAPVEPSEEGTAVVTPEPDEPFDNRTYKNYQHHNYTTFTFADLDVEMAKFRLPQPSSRH